MQELFRYFKFVYVLDPHYENTGISLYNARGSIAFLEEIDQGQPSDDVVEIKEDNHVYVNIKITKISISSLWEYKLEHTAHGTFDTEFKVWYNCLIVLYDILCDQYNCSMYICVISNR